MKYSFVIPTHNNKALLRNTLEALNYQLGYGRNDYEVIVVDDGSTDQTVTYIQGVNRNYELRYFYLERDTNSSRSRTRNYGWRNAQGAIAVFIDSDILVRRDYLAELDRCFAVGSNLMVIGNRLMLDQATRTEDIVSGALFDTCRFAAERLETMDYRYFVYETASYNANALLFPWMQVYSCNMAVPKAYLEQSGGFDENFKGWGMEDVELGYALCSQGLQLVINSKLEVLHQYHGERNDLFIRPENLGGYEKNVDYFLNKHPQALRMSRKHAHRFLKGEISDDKFLVDRGLQYQAIDFKFPERLESLKKAIAQVMLQSKTILSVQDYVENTDLDIWIQRLGNAGHFIQYYPMSKRINRELVIQFLKTEKERELMQA